MNELVARDIDEQARAVVPLLDHNELELVTARSLVRSAASVRLLALGSSRHAAGYGAELLGSHLGVPAVAAPAPGWGTSQAPWARGELALVVTQSGRTPALVQAVREARAAGVPVVLVVNGDDSPLHELADVAIDLGVGPERVVAATKSVTAQLVALRALAASLDPAVLSHALAAALTSDVAPALVGDVPRAVVCGGFAGEWVAAEVALKFGEMLGHFVAAESLVEFCHGPTAAVGAVLAMVPAGDPNAAVLASRPDAAVGSSEGGAFLVPATGDESLDPVVRLVVGQRVVLGWAARLGEDADASRGLSKVTATR